MRAAIHVCPRSRLADTLVSSCARSVVTLLAADQRAGLPPLPGLSHLMLDVSDITVPREGLALAGEAHLAELLGFARSWDRRHPLLIHCYAGVSRSTAAAYAIACALDPTRVEAEIPLRSAAPRRAPRRTRASWLWPTRVSAAPAA